MKYQLTPVIAHVERYVGLFRKSDYEELLSIPNAVYQISTNFMESKKTADFVAGLIRSGPVSYTHLDVYKRQPPLRRLYVMAFFLSELSKVKIPPCGGQYTKLYDIFTKELYELLSSGTLRDASPSLRALTAAAVRLQAFPEAETCFSCMPPRPADQKD